MAKRQAESGFDSMGQPIGIKKGEPDPKAQELVEAANADNAVAVDEDELQPLVEVKPRRKAKKDTPEPARLIDQILAEAQDDPTAKSRLVDLLAAAPNAAEVLGITPGRGAPRGEYQRNYRQEEALRVYGGVEVEHEPGWEPLPPSWIPMYQTADGRTTSQRADALQGAGGSPVKTQEYKLWLDHHAAGTKMDGNVRFDIAADQTMASDVGVLR
jgi:hypothetical protein